MKKLILGMTDKKRSVVNYMIVVFSLFFVNYGGAWIALFFLWAYQHLEEIQNIPKIYIFPGFHIGNYGVWGIILIIIAISVFDEKDNNMWLVVVPLIGCGYYMIRHQFKYYAYLERIVLLLEQILNNKYLDEKKALLTIDRGSKKYDGTQLKQMLDDLQKNKFITYVKDIDLGRYCINIISPKLRKIALEKREVEEWECESCGAINKDNSIDDPICEYCGIARPD